MQLPLKQNPKRLVFCDFDGTITAVETFVGMLKEFAPVEAAKLIPEMYARRLTLKEGVRKILESIPSQIYNEMIEYAADKPIRPGLEELLDFLHIQGVPFVVVSGGLRDMVEKVLSRSLKARLRRPHPTKPLIEKIASLSAVEIDTSGDYLRVHSDFEGDTELVAKVKVMEQYGAEQTIAIGDSITDLNMALQADVVFARDRLIQYLEAENKPYLKWNNFFDVRDRLAQIWDNEE